MFTKVLVAEDMDDTNKGVYTMLCELNINKVHPVQYCDDAYLQIKKGVFDQEPYQLLITDLGFVVDHRNEKYPSGEALIEALREEHSNLKIIVYSGEDRLQKVRTLMNKYQVNGYVCKGRRGLQELSKAILSVHNNEPYLSPEVANALSSKTNLEVDDYDIDLLMQLSEGLSQSEISIHFKNNDITPSSLSSIEKTLNKLRIQFKANNAIHLVAIVKDLGLI